MKRGVRNAILWVLALGFCAFLANRYTDDQLTKDLGSYTKEQFDLVYNGLSRVYYPNLAVEGGAFFYEDELLMVEELPALSEKVLVTVTPFGNGKSLSVSLKAKNGEYSAALTDWQLWRKIEGSWYQYGWFDASGQLAPSKQAESSEFRAFSEDSFTLTTFFSHPVEDFEKNVTYWDCPLETGVYLLLNENLRLDDGSTAAVGREFDLVNREYLQSSPE